MQSSAKSTHNSLHSKQILPQWPIAVTALNNQPHFSPEGQPSAPVGRAALKAARRSIGHLVSDHLFFHQAGHFPEFILLVS